MATPPPNQSPIIQPQQTNSPILATTTTNISSPITNPTATTTTTTIPPTTPPQNTTTTTTSNNIVQQQPPTTTTTTTTTAIPSTNTNINTIKDTPPTTTNTSTTNLPKSPTPSTNKDRSTDLAVLDYLKKRGYSNAEAILKQELFNTSQSPISPSDDENVTFSNNNTTTTTTTTNDINGTTNDQELTQYLLMYNSNQKDTLNPQNYLESYKKLGNWIHSSLDIYKNELLSILYPVFVHSYIDLITKGYPTHARELMDQIGPDHEEYFGDDLKLLRGISNTDHLKENELVDLFRNNRWNIKMCAYSFELLMSFLHQSNFILLLSIINQYIHINVSNLRPGFIDDEQYSISFQSEKDAGDLNSTPINYHAFKPDYEDDALLQLKEKQQLDQIGILSPTDPNAPPPPVVAPPPPPPPTSGYIPKLKKKDKKKKETKDERMLKIQSNVPIPILTEKFEHELMDDFTKCVSLSSSHLPSICFYTIFNTYQGLNTTDISRDAQLVAGGFSDSSVKVWNLKEMKERQLERQQEQQQQNGFENGNFASSASGASSANNNNNNTATTTTTTTTTTTANGINGKSKTTTTNIINLKQKHESEFKTFLGHSGPVYGCSFSPDSQYLLSCSEDTTARLWSMETMSNLVCYKGHNFPVWDVSFSPFGFYFATASHDRTARLWTTNNTTPLRIFAGHLSDCNTVRFHPNINYLATGSNDKSARLWEIQTGKCVRIFMGHRAPIYSIAFSPDGRLLATAGEDTSVILWDLSTGKKVKKMDGHTKCVYSLDFSQDGSVLASGSSDCTVRLWDVKKAFNNSLSTTTQINDEFKGKRKSLKSKLFSDELLETYPTKQTPVYNVCFSRRNLLLASGAFNTLTAFDKF